MRNSAALTLIDAYQEYLLHGGTVDIETYMLIVEEFNCEVMDLVITQGVRFEMGSNLSGLSILRIPINNKKPPVDWKASNENKAKLIAEGRIPKNEHNPNGENWLIFITEVDHYMRFYWNKKACTIPGYSAYRFDATRGAKGNKTKLTQLLKTDPFAEFNYDSPP